MSDDAHNIMTMKVPAGTRTWRFDLKLQDARTRVLSISDCDRTSQGKRTQIVIEEQHIPELHRALTAVLAWLDPQGTHEKPYPEIADSSPVRAYAPWTLHEEAKLREGYGQGQGVNELAACHGRAPTAIISRMYQLGIIKANDSPRWSSDG